MALRLKRSADQFPAAGWKPDNDHLVVMTGEVVMGSMKKLVGGPSDGHWSWSVTCVYVPPNQAAMFGVEATREQAQESMARAWRRWLARAALKEAE